MSFDPKPHIIQISSKGGGKKDYLPVVARVIWLRYEYPAADIHTELVQFDDQFALFKASVRLVDHGGEIKGAATGYGSETFADFKDYIEKAERKAVGRALAMVGYGTEFAVELDDSAEPIEQPVEAAPAQKRQDAPGATIGAKTTEAPASARTAPARPQNGARTGGSVGSSPISDRQLKFIEQLATELGMPDEELHALAKSMFNVDRYSGLSRRDASTFIDALQHRQPANR